MKYLTTGALTLSLLASPALAESQEKHPKHDPSKMVIMKLFRQGMDDEKNLSKDKAVALLEKYFTAADTNSDGIISKDEIKSIKPARKHHKKDCNKQETVESKQ